MIDDQILPFGPDHPHPLSQLKTELIWQGTYDLYGKRLAPLRLKLPFQTVETVIETAPTFARLVGSAIISFPVHTLVRLLPGQAGTLPQPGTL